MSEKIGIKIVGRNFTVDADGEFATFLQDQITQDFNFEGNNSVETLLLAYVRRTHNLFLQEKEMAKIVEKLDKI